LAYLHFARLLRATLIDFHSALPFDAAGPPLGLAGSFLAYLFNYKLLKAEKGILIFALTTNMLRGNARPVENAAENWYDFCQFSA